MYAQTVTNYAQPRLTNPWELLAISRETYKPNTVNSDPTVSGYFKAKVSPPTNMLSLGTMSIQISDESPFIENWVSQNPTGWYSIQPQVLEAQPDTSESLIQVLSPGTDEFVQMSVGVDVYKKLSPNDREFLKVASNLYNLGESINIDDILKSIRENNGNK